jgi:CHAD domain-containing protein
VQEILDGKVSARSLRAMLWAGLQDEHPEVSLKDAGKLLGAIGVKRGLDVMLEAVQYFYPAPDPASPRPDPPMAPVSQTPAPSTPAS